MFTDCIVPLTYLSRVCVFRELLKQEGLLAKMYCRRALLELITQCNSPAMELTSCSSGLGTAMAASAALLQVRFHAQVTAFFSLHLVCSRALYMYYAIVC